MDSPRSSGHPPRLMIVRHLAARICFTLLLVSAEICIIRVMKAIIIAMVFMAVIYLSRTVSNGDADMQTTALILSGLVLIWYTAKIIYCAHKNRDKSTSQ